MLLSGILAIAGAGAIIGACAIPFASALIGGHRESVSIFSRPGASADSLWFAVEPVSAAVLAIVAGVLIMAVRRGRLSGVALIVIGIQTVFLFLGYAFGDTSATIRMGPAGPVGVVAGVLVAVAGLMGVASQRHGSGGR